MCERFKVKEKIKVFITKLEFLLEWTEPSIVYSPWKETVMKEKGVVFNEPWRYSAFYFFYIKEKNITWLLCFERHFLCSVRKERPSLFLLHTHTTLNSESLTLFSMNIYFHFLYLGNNQREKGVRLRKW